MRKFCEEICKQHLRMTEFFHYVREEHGRISPKISTVKNKHWRPSGYLCQKKLGTKHKVIFLNVSYVSGKKTGLP